MPVRTVFCQKCHRAAMTIVRGEEGIVVRQGEKVLIRLGKGSSIKGCSVNCPAGHPVKLDVGEAGQ